ncbi:molybdopterin-binding protein [Prosthecomicrobium pneumaticum]|uniref:Molybdopterin molybdenumtransferase n=1 Tax=Prosthecomicrobium pneumaticum TaxID=81895 RepID=A0A7W9FKN6_9HYPH|nr:molybdopterin molybdotransferase [Prosthecomicrobium pneumaticum]
MNGLLPVEEALARVLDGIAPTPAEDVPIAEAFRRVLAAPLAARRTQPPYAVSAMDGYALRAADAASVGAALRPIGTAPAGTPFAGRVGEGETVRIFTGGALPEGADSVLLQEDAQVEDGRVIVREAVRPGQHVRPRGLDFAEGAVLLPAPRRLGMREIAIAAAMNHWAVPVRRQPTVAILATGDELAAPAPDVPAEAIVASNSYGIAALAIEAGARPVDRGIVRDDRAALAAAIEAALAEEPDVLVTLGGASVGEHDLVRGVLGGLGVDLDFWKIAMRPGKPLMFGRRGGTRILGLPGNPVSSLVCGLLFLRPLLDALLGLPPADPTEPAELGAPMAQNDRRRDYVRAMLAERPGAPPLATPFPRQDSSMLSTLAASGCLIVRPPHAPAAAAGAPIRILRLP